MSSPMPDDKIHLYEYEAVEAPDSLERRRIAELCCEVRRLRHELNDPNYLYVGRIHRQAIIFRDGEINRLRAEIAELKRQLAGEPTGA